MTHYITHDTQGGTFMEWTHETPQTFQQLQAYLYAMSNENKTNQDDLWTWSNFRHNFTKDELCNEWGIELEAVTL